VTMTTRRWLALLLALFCSLARAQFDPSHSAWDGLVKRHVQWLPDNRQSRVDYAAFQRDRGELKRVLDAMSAVSRPTFDGWPREQRMAFLINAYNAFTVELILTKYPDLKSIKDLGTLFQSPWRLRFFTLLGEPRHLDWIEHEQLRRSTAIRACTPPSTALRSAARRCATRRSPPPGSRPSSKTA